MASSMDMNFVVEEAEDDEDSENFTFILGPDGELKHMLIPQDALDDLPLEVQAILELLGIDDITKITNRTLH
jgi:hypothetical protein